MLNRVWPVWGLGGPSISTTQRNTSLVAPLLPSIACDQHSHRHGSHQASQGKDGDGQRVHEGERTLSQALSIASRPCRIIEGFYVLQRREMLHGDGLNAKIWWEFPLHIHQILQILTWINWSYRMSGGKGVKWSELLGRKRIYSTWSTKARSK